MSGLQEKREQTSFQRTPIKRYPSLKIKIQKLSEFLVSCPFKYYKMSMLLHLINLIASLAFRICMISNVFFLKNGSWAYILRKLGLGHCCCLPGCCCCWRWRPTWRWPSGSWRGWRGGTSQACTCGREIRTWDKVSFYYLSTNLITRKTTWT